jgi:transposase
MAHDDGGLLDSNSPSETTSRRCPHCGSVDMEPTGWSHGMVHRPLKVARTCNHCGKLSYLVPPAG